MNTEIKNLNNRIVLLEKQVYWLKREKELLTIQKERAESLLTN